MFKALLLTALLVISNQGLPEGCCLYQPYGLCWLTQWPEDAYITVAEPLPAQLVLWTTCGKYFVLLGSSTGYHPGIPILDCTLGLNLDHYNSYLLMNPDAWIKPSWGELVHASIDVKTLEWDTSLAPPEWKGKVLYHLVIVFDENLVFSGISNPVETQIG